MKKANLGTRCLGVRKSVPGLGRWVGGAIRPGVVAAPVLPGLAASLEAKGRKGDTSGPGNC